MPPLEETQGAGSAGPETNTGGESAPSGGGAEQHSPEPGGESQGAPHEADPSSDWGGLGEDSYDDITEGLDVGGTEPAQGTPGEPGEQQPGPQGGPQPQQQDGQQQAPEDTGQKPGSEGGEQQPQAAAAGDLPSFDDGIDGLLNVFQQNYGDLVNAVAQARFQLSQEELEELETDVAAAVPKLLAKAQVNSLHAMLHYTKQVVPQMIQSTMGRHNLAMGVERAFFNEFPQLNRQEHGQTIQRVAEMLYQQNPNMQIPDLLRQTGRMVMGAYGIQATPPQPQGQGQRTQRRQAAPAFQPAAAGGRHVQSTPLPDSPFAGLGMDFDEG